jgi:hypothetical protein
MYRQEPEEKMFLTKIVRFGLKLSVWTAAAAIYKDSRNRYRLKPNKSVNCNMKLRPRLTT